MEVIVQLLRAGVPIVFPIALLAFIILSAVLNYHWTRYGVEKTGIKRVRRWYFGMSAFWFALILFSFVSIVWSTF